MAAYLHHARLEGLELAYGFDHVYQERHWWILSEKVELRSFIHMVDSGTPLPRDIIDISRHKFRKLRNLELRHIDIAALERLVPYLQSLERFCLWGWLADGIASGCEMLNLLARCTLLEEVILTVIGDTAFFDTAFEKMASSCERLRVLQIRPPGPEEE